MTEIMTIVPSQQKRILVTSGEQSEEFFHPGEIVKGFELLKGEEQGVAAWLDGFSERQKRDIGRRLQLFRQLQGKEPVVGGIMGGLGQALFIRAADMAIPVQRIPIFRLQDATGIMPGSSAEARAQAIAQAWEQQPDAFYPIAPVTPAIAIARELARERLAIQDLRKPMQLRLYHALREVRYVLPREAEQVVDLIEEAAKKMFQHRGLQEQIEQALRRLQTLLGPEEGPRVLAVTRHYANPRFIIGAKEDEEDIEKQILNLLSPLKIWSATHPKSNSALPPIKGLGAALGGATISETGDIRRFHDASTYRAYARFHLVEKGGENVFPRRMAGIHSSWNQYLNRVVWLWSNNQVLRYDHPWTSLFLWKKARELQAHTEPIPKQVIDRKGRQKTIYLYTLKHLHSRAARWTGSQLLEYLHRLWLVVERGEDPEEWYRRSSWPAYFSAAEAALQGGLKAYLEQETPKRRRTEPQEPQEEDEESP